MWLFGKKEHKNTIQAKSVEIIDGFVTIDVRGQTCPGYLLAINKEIDKVEKGTDARLLITYPPCHEDILAWCKERHYEFKDIIERDGSWIVTIKK